MALTEDSRTLWIGNLEDRVTEELLYELFLQTGPIERLILPTEGEGEEKKHMGHAYVVFQHPESVQYASQVMEGSSLFAHPLAIKARALPANYKKTNLNAQAKGRYDNSSLRGGMNKSSTWHGGNDFAPRGRGNFRNNRGGVSNYAQNTTYNTGYNYNTTGSQLANSGYWMTGQQQASTDTTQTTYSTANTSLDDKRQRLLQQQSATLEAHRQMQQGVMNMYMGQSQWNNSGYSTGTWNMGGDTTGYQGYTDQYGTWYQQ